jgi:glutamate/tyrosine decarboxylase-like PLP-dependent enzyme
VVFIATFASIVLTFLAGAEVDPDDFRERFGATVSIGLVSFIGPFVVAWLVAWGLLGWELKAALIAGTALSTTSLAVVYAVLVGTFAEYGLEQTRPFRALKTWATVAARGRAGIAAQVARANALARELATLVEREPELELAAAPETSIVAFRARPAGCPPARLDELNRALPEAVQARGRAFVTGTVFGGRETLRACVLHPDTSREHLATLVAEVVARGRTLVATG